jgi:hypothetical protein
MRTLEVSRTLVKSPPELWAELSGERFVEALGGASTRVTEEERRIEWEAGGASGAAVLEPAGWGTKLILTARVEEEVTRLEPEVARIGLWSRLRGVRPAPAPPQPPKPGPRPEELERSLERLLDELGSARRRPFQNG